MKINIYINNKEKQQDYKTKLFWIKLLDFFLLIFYLSVCMRVAFGCYYYRMSECKWMLFFVLIENEAEAESPTKN